VLPTLQFFRDYKFSTFAWILIAAVSLWHLFSVRLSDENALAVIDGDGAGYYAWLPATFIYHDLNFGFTEREDPAFRSVQARDIRLFGMRNEEGKRINKYFTGTAILQLPFFLLALGAAAVSGQPVDGYSFPFQLFIGLAGVFYLLAGLFCTWKILRQFKIPDAAISVALLLLFFGTNLFFYALREPSMSHVYSFFLIAFFILQGTRLRNEKKSAAIYWLALSYALIILVRPTNGIVLLLLPVIWANELRSTVYGILMQKKQVVGSILLFAAILFVQLLAWEIESGHWYNYTYGEEKIDLLHPNLADVLWSWRKGFFVYTPLMLIALAGLFFIRPVKTGILLTCVLFLHAWITASWSAWPYGGSLGMRPMIDFYSAYAIPLGFIFANLKSTKRAIVISLSAVFCFLNLFQHYQYYNRILPYDGMSWQKYKRLFLVSSPVFRDLYAPLKPNGEIPEGAEKFFSFKRDFETDSSFRNRQGIVSDQKFTSKPASVRLNYITRQSPDLYVKLNPLLPDTSVYDVWAQGSVDVWLEDDETDAKFVFVFKDWDSAYSWQAFYLVHGVEKSKKWTRYSYAVKVPRGKGIFDLVSIYVIKDDESWIYLDDLEISLWKIAKKL
jgi:hypothetical protein